MQPASDHRPDIDWLRAIAVITVIGFHFEIPGFRGGFVGVDIFFVISGLLIGRIIQTELAVGTFSFLSFYERRIRRLIPALYVMVVIVGLLGAGLLFGSERADFLRSIFGVVTFTANVLFWSQSGYFDRAASEKPLLHTWSLGVEEQFYILLPFVLWLLFRFQNILFRRAGVVALAVCSLALSQWLLRRDAAEAFFLIHSRAWELLAGVMLTWLPVIRLGGIAHVLRIAGLTLIAFAVLSYTPRSAFPGVNALLPVLGAALFLSAGPTYLRARPVELIGQMSYSLYLWHWPIFTLAKLSSVTQTVGGSEKAILLAVLAVVAPTSYFLVERPARYAPASQRIVLSSAAAATAILVFAGLIGTRSLDTTITDPRIAALQKYEALTGAERVGSCFVEDWTTNEHRGCFSANDQGQAALLWGDSLADQYFRGLAKDAPKDIALLQANAAACFPTFKPIFKQYDFCDALANRVGSFIATKHPSKLIISADWLGYSKRAGSGSMIASLRDTVAASGVPVVIIGPSVQFRGRLPSILIRAYSRGKKLPSSQDIFLNELSALDREMKAAFVGAEGVTYVSALDAICPDQSCPLVLENNAPLTWDHGHLTDEGSAYAASRMAPAIFSRNIASP